MTQGGCVGQDRPLLVLENLSIGYNAVLASEISARINAGEVIAVLGPSGVGKTTLVRTIAGLVEPIGGRVDLHVDRRGGLGYIPQKLGLVRHASVYHNVNLGARASLPVLQGDSEERKKRVNSALIALGIEEKTTEPVRRLSGGQLRRVATARALAQRPSLLLADEFLSELDHNTVDVVIAAVKEMLDAGTSMVMVEHHEENVALLATRVWLIEDEKFYDFSIDEWRERVGEEE
ncbi:MAG TPA: ATP-binding cassette domain-containing protein [Candidatus Poseidoniales archaeon]|nr:MAG TPA: ATP-binding cassette domain-containing protein [Candidatus Poseidoniales archaeon]